jgi:hypothetical protein
VRVRKEPHRRKVKVNAPIKASVANAVSAVSVAVVAAEAVVVAAVVAAVTMPVARRQVVAVAKARAPTRPVTARTHLASRTATIQARAPLRAAQNRSITPSLANITPASPPPLRPPPSLANPKLTAAATSSRCGPLLPAPAAAPGAPAGRVGTSKN